MSFQKSAYMFLDTLPYQYKSNVILIGDLLVVCFALYSAFALRLNRLWPHEWLVEALPLFVIVIVSCLILGHLFYNHKIKLRSYEVISVQRLALWAALVALIATVSNLVFELGAPRTVPIILGPIAFFLAFLVRASAIPMLSWLGQIHNQKSPVAIYGAGEA